MISVPAGSADRARSVRDDGRDPLQRIADLAAEVTGFGRGSIVFVDGPASRILAATGADRPQFLAVLDERVARENESLVIADLSQAGDLGPDVRGAYLGVPVVDRDGGPIGALSVSDPGSRLLHDRHLRLVTELAGIAGDQLDLMRRADALDDDHHAVAELAAAVVAGQIVPWYQPMIDLRTERIVGVEALARRQLPSGAMLGPDTFIPLAEQTDLIVELDLAVIRHALADLARWQQIYPELRISLNLSGRHLDHDDWADVIKQLAHDAGVAAETIDLELTETARPTDIESGRTMMDRVRQLGFLIWFDDFGTGWSALQDLLELPVDGIKIDRSFAAALGEAGDDAIVRALITAAAELGLKVTIEGIETADQARRAVDLGCDYAQGYLWSPGVPAPALEALLRRVADGSPFPRVPVATAH